MFSGPWQERMQDQPIQSDSAEAAALYAAGALTAEDRAQFEARLADGDPAALRAMTSFEPVVRRLADAVAATPPPRIRASLLARIAGPRGTNAAAVRSAEAAAAGLYYQHAQDAAWDDIGIPGIRMRRLFVDRERHTETFLLRVDPGTTVPAHTHHLAEDCLILQGDLHTYGMVMRAGDFFRAPAATEHPPSRTEAGCLLLVTAGIGDEHSETE